MRGRVTREKHTWPGLHPQPDETRARCCIAMAVPSKMHRMSKTIPHFVHWLLDPTYIEWIVLSHFINKLFLDPVSNSRAPVLIKPSASLNFSFDPFLLTLLGEYPSKTCVICRAPECKVEEEENLSSLARECKIENDLQAQKSQVQQIEMTFRITGMEKCGQNVLSRWHTKD